MDTATVPELPEEATDAGTTPPVETEQVSDEELLRRIQAEMANRPQTPKRVSLMDLYHQTVSLVSGALGYRTPKLRSEAHAVKLWELTLMWALNNRTGEPSHDIIPTADISGALDEESGEESEGEELPTPHEVIEALEDQSDPEV